MAELPLLSYADIIGMNYIPASAGIVLSAAEQTMAVQAVSIFGFSEMWADYDTNADDIESLVASTQFALLNTEIPPPVSMSSNIMLLPDMASVTSGATPVWVGDTASSLGGYWQASPALTGDSYQWEFYLAAGKYNIDMWYNRTTANGRVNINIYDASGALITTVAVDLRGAAQKNTRAGNSFDNPTPGRIKIVVAGNGTTGATFFRPIQRIVVDKYAEL